MSMIRFDLAAERGGRKEFSDLAEAILWTQEQERAWTDVFGNQITSADHRLALPSRRWREVTSELQGQYKQGHPIARTIPGASDLIAANSPVFMALQWVAAQLTTKGLLAAATAAGLGGKVNWVETAETDGVLLYERVLAKVLQNTAGDLFTKSQEDADTIANRVQTASDLLSKIEGQIAQIASAASESEANARDRVVALEAAVSATEFSANERLATINAHVDAADARAVSAIERLTENSKTAIDNWFAGFKEQRQLEAPVLLWETRASAHEATLAARKWWMIGIGAAGIIVAVLVALGAFELAQRVFQSAVMPTGKGQTATVGGMRPSFHFELLFASAGTLIYLTMYIWTMKLLVRLYATEHHLALDARGRAALTETYLSLTSKGAATDADRAIMLAVIFRPVADGMVKEDGPPAISPAALLAGFASAPAKAA